MLGSAANGCKEKILVSHHFFCLTYMMNIQDSTRGVGWLLDDGDMLWQIVFREKSAGGERRAEPCL